VPLKGPRLLNWVYEQIGCESIDAVNLRNGKIMAVDDNGWECEMVQLGPGHFAMKPLWPRKPINAEATKIYHTVCRPGTTHQIAGDVAICRDKDFA
jgi:hypothetical protein